MSVFSEIENVLHFLEGRRGYSPENTGPDLIAKSILLLAKAEKESADLVVKEIRELQQSIEFFLSLKR